MPNLIPIDFYAEGKPNNNLPLGLHTILFFREMGKIFNWAGRGCLRGGQTNGFGHSVHETQLSQSVILKLSVLGYAIG